jgi:hypothetical protein
MGKQGHGVRSRPGGNELERWRVLGKRYFLDANARLNQM